MNSFNQSDSGLTAKHPPACPECASSSVTTTDKHPDVNSYWRCEQCGEIWNIGRRRHDGPGRAIAWR